MSERLEAIEELIAMARGVPDCSRCDGTGEITWNPSRIHDPQQADYAECPVCHGEGEVLR